MAALFALNPITRTPAAYVLGSETAAITFGEAALNYTNLFGTAPAGNGLVVPMPPTIAEPAWYGLAVFIELFGSLGNAGTPRCYHGYYPQSVATNGTTSVVLDTNLDYTGTAPALVAPGALASLPVSDPPAYI